jgi:uncharacterized membrane protein
MHYFPIAYPFLAVLLLLFLLLLILVEVGILEFAYHKIGIKQRYIFALLLLSLLGSYVNIPVYQLPPEAVRSGGIVFYYGVPYVIPLVTEWPGTVIAANLGGAVIPTLLALFLMVKNRLYLKSLLGVAVVALLVHLMAKLAPGVGIVVPTLIPPALAAIAGLTLCWRLAPALGYIVGTLGTLIGADLSNLGRIQGLGAPVASIGGAGTFDGVFTTGILAVLLASFMRGKAPAPDGDTSCSPGSRKP